MQQSHVPLAWALDVAIIKNAIAYVAKGIPAAKEYVMAYGLINFARACIRVDLQILRLLFDVIVVEAGVLVIPVETRVVIRNVLVSIAMVLAHANFLRVLPYATVIIHVRLIQYHLDFLAGKNK